MNRRAGSGPVAWLSLRNANARRTDIFVLNRAVNRFSVMALNSLKRSIFNGTPSGLSIFAVALSLAEGADVTNPWSLLRSAILLPVGRTISGLIDLQSLLYVQFKTNVGS